MEAGSVLYYVYVTTESGSIMNITQAVEDLGWNDSEKELSQRITFKMYNATYNKTKLSKLIKINQRVTVKADWGTGQKVVAEGFIKEAEQEEAKSSDRYIITAYDILFNMQKSQDSIYYEAGQSTNGLITGIFSSWGIPVGAYTGANATHPKVVYKNKRLSDIMLDLLKEAEKKGGCKSVVRVENGKACVLKIGTNKEVYYLNSKNCLVARNKISILNMVTRVKILSTDSKEETAPKVEAVVDGKTSYGILQRIVTASSAESIEEAKTEAQETLDENGSPKETYTLQAPDVPPVRKGDKIVVSAGSMHGNFWVKGVQHNAEQGKMSLDVEPLDASADSSSSGGTGGQQGGGRNVGDLVQFHGGMHYVTSLAGSTGYSVSAGPARIHAINPSGAHPYSLITTDWNQTNVYGWVDEGSFS